MAKSFTRDQLMEQAKNHLLNWKKIANQKSMRLNSRDYEYIGFLDIIIRECEENFVKG